MKSFKQYINENKEAIKFIEPVIKELKSEFKKVGLNLSKYSMELEKRYDDNKKYSLTLILGRDIDLFDEGSPGEVAIQKVSDKYKKYLGLGFTESIGTASSTTGPTIPIR